jgi:hypothetical protein
VPTCTMSGAYPELSLLAVGTVTTVGVERWHEVDVAADVRPINIAGFPALVAVPRQFTDYCSVEVDVAAGQLLDIQYGRGGSSDAPTQDELCRQAGRSAAQVMETLLAR